MNKPAKEMRVLVEPPYPSKHYDGSPFTELQAQWREDDCWHNGHLDFSSILDTVGLKVEPGQVVLVSVSVLGRGHACEANKKISVVSQQDCLPCRERAKEKKSG